MAKIKKGAQLSLIPNCSKKFLLVDGPKDINVELRCLPALEMTVLLPEAYPSTMGLMVHMNTPFYQPLESFLNEKLNEKWVEDMIVLYECVYFVQDEFLNAYFDSEGGNDTFKINQKGQVEIKF